MPSRERSASWPDALLVGLLTSLAALAWYVLWLGGRSPYGHALLHSSHMLEGYGGWWLAAVSVGGWTVMTIAMMLPTTLPLVVLFRRIVGERATAARLLAVLIAGYIGVWVMCGLALQTANWILQAGTMRWFSHSAAGWISAAVVLGIAGLYQFSPLKYACLEKCRSPYAFIVSRWQGGSETAQALRIGVEHGLFCVGCCWSLMLLMFVVGFQSLGWMLLLGAVMALEKNVRWGRRLSAPVGVLLLVGAVVVVVNGVRP